MSFSSQVRKSSPPSEENHLFKVIGATRRRNTARKARPSFTVVEDYKLDLNLVSDSDESVEDGKREELSPESFKKKDRIFLEVLAEKTSAHRDSFNL